MIVARIAKGVTGHLAARAMEWLFAAILSGWGFVLLFYRPLFDRPVYAALARMAGQGDWGVGCLAVGVLRLVALTINGTFADTWWSRFSPHVRAGMAYLSCFFWTTISFSVVSDSDPGTGLAVYPAFLLFELYNIVRASSDARHSDEAYRHGRHLRG